MVSSPKTGEPAGMKSTKGIRTKRYLFIHSRYEHENNCQSIDRFVLNSLFISNIVIIWLSSPHRLVHKPLIFRLDNGCYERGRDILET